MKTKESYSSKDHPVAPIDLCKDLCAIDPRKTYNYDTDLGRGEYVIPYPDKSTLTEISNHSNTITYSCSGGDFKSPNIKYKYEIKSGLSRNAGDKLTIIVEFLNFDCNGSNVAQKRKKSVIQGHPIVLECSIID